MLYEMGIEDNQDTLISEMYKGVKRGESPFCKIWRKNIVIAVFCYNYAERYIKKGKQIYYWGTGSLLIEKTKNEKKTTGQIVP